MAKKTSTKKEAVVVKDEVDDQEMIGAADKAELDTMIASLKRQSSKSSKPPVVTKKVLETYLGYECAFGKHKGESWMKVYTEDVDYFKWAMIKFMEPHTSLWQVLSVLLTQGEREAALRR